MRILTISNYYPSHPGGIEIVAQNLVARWRKKNQVRWMACDIFSLHNKLNEDDIPLKANNFTETHFGFPYPIPTPTALLKVIKQVRWCDIVHIHDCLYLANFVAFLAGRFLSKSIVVTQHISPIPYKETYKKILQAIAYATIGKLVLERANQIIFVNAKVQDWFSQKMKLRKSSVIQNGVDSGLFFASNKDERNLTRKKLGSTKADKLLLFIGRLTQKKGLHLIHEIAKQRPNYKWIVVGNGEIDVSKWGLENIKVFPHQNQATLRSFYIAADLFILPSQGEGFPLVVQEALACGLPAVVSEEIALSLPSAPLISLDTSSLSKVLDTIDRIIKSEELLRETRQRSLMYAKTWDWNVIADQYLVQFSKNAQQK
ncbi:MAG: glycosyltransferase family 4 protein [Anaerolineales bacterium]|nr:glycosyltransferase family 4 protein [Anaerolineales bacterium]